MHPWSCELSYISSSFGLSTVFGLIFSSMRRKLVYFITLKKELRNFRHYPQARCHGHLITVGIFYDIN